MQELRMCALSGIGEIVPGSDLGALLVRAADENGMPFLDGDICILAHKIVSKSEGRLVQLDSLTPRPEAERLAQLTGKPAALIECILRESHQVFAYRTGALICRTRHGWVCANAGVDLSNATKAGEAVLLPIDPDASAKEIGMRIQALTGARVAVVITDTHGRSLRNGITGVAIGCYGVAPLRSYIGGVDRMGRRMEVSTEAVVDELAGAASLLMGQGSEGIPAVQLRGWDAPFDPQGIGALCRPAEKELFSPVGAAAVWTEAEGIVE